MIVFSGRGSGVYDIFTMNSDGSMIQRLTAGSGSNEHPRWSPDGRYIVFSSTRDGKPFHLHDALRRRQPDPARKEDPRHPPRMEPLAG
jgi:Tol biopolymer transport system component